jgi:hypothetical protein
VTASLRLLAAEIVLAAVIFVELVHATIRNHISDQP